MTAITVQDLDNAKVDVDTIADVATSTQDYTTDRLGHTKLTLTGAINSMRALNPRGAWTTATAYAVRDLVTQGGVTYVVTQAHTSGTFATDLAAGKLAVYQGLVGTDLANNSDPTKGAALVGVDGNTLSVQIKNRIKRLVHGGITELKTLDKTKYTAADTTGYYGDGTGGGRSYWCDLTDTTTADNGVTVHVAADGGRWKLVHDGTVTWGDAGARANGSDATARINAALNCGVKTILAAPAGDYVINGTLTPPTSTLELIGLKGTRLMAGVNGLTMFKSTVSAYYTRVRNLLFHGNGKTSVVGMDMIGMRLDSGLLDCKFQNLNTGFIGRDGCFGLNIDNLTTEAVHNPIIFINNNSGTTINNPQFDNGSGVGGDGTGTAITIQASGSNLGVNIRGGYIQGFETGVFANGIGDVIDGTYFENCSVADIQSNGGSGLAKNMRVRSTNAWASTGPCHLKLRNYDGAYVDASVMGSGGRTGMFDVPASGNTNNVLFLQGSTTGMNLPLGDVSGFSRIYPRVEGTFTPTVAGSSTAGSGTYTNQTAKYSYIGGTVRVSLAVGWTAHSGTGNLVIKGIPAGLAPVSFTPRRIAKVEVAGFAVTGPQVVAYLNGTNCDISILTVNTSGVEALMGLPAAGQVYLSIEWDT